LASIVGLAQFVLMESVKNPSFSLGTCQSLLKSVSDDQLRATVVSRCKTAFDVQITQAQWADSTNKLIGWVNPLTFGVYKSFFEVNVVNLGFERSLFEVAVQADVKPPMKNSTCLKPSVVVVSKQETDLSGVRDVLGQLASEGFFIKSSYSTKLNGSWCVVFVLEKVSSVAC